MIGITVAIECAVESVASIGADARSIRLDLVRDVEAVVVHEAALDAQISVRQFVKVDLHLEVARLDAVDGKRSRAHRVQLVQLLAADGVRLVAERVLDGFDTAREVHLRQVEGDERVRLEARRVNDPAANKRQWEGRREAGRRQRSILAAQKIATRR